MLYQNALLDTVHNKKFKEKWLGPYQVLLRLDKGSYVIREVGGARLKRRAAARRLRRFYPRGEVDNPDDDEPEEENESSVEGNSEDSDSETEDSRTASETASESEESGRDSGEQDSDIEGPPATRLRSQTTTQEISKRRTPT